MDSAVKIVQSSEQHNAKRSKALASLTHYEEDSSPSAYLTAFESELNLMGLSSDLDMMSLFPT